MCNLQDAASFLKLDVPPLPQHESLPGLKPDCQGGHFTDLREVFYQRQVKVADRPCESDRFRSAGQRTAVDQAAYRRRHEVRIGHGPFRSCASSACSCPPCTDSGFSGGQEGGDTQGVCENRRPILKCTTLV